MLEKFKALAATTCVAATAIVSVATQASAAALYTLTQGTSSGGTISGSFDFDGTAQDGAVNQYTNVAISTAGGNTTTFPPESYTNVYSPGSSSQELDATTQSRPNNNPYVDLVFPSPLTGQPRDAESASVDEVNSLGQPRTFSSVTVTSAAAAVPEPDGTSGIGLVILGGGGWLLKRKIAPSMKAKALSIQ